MASDLDMDITGLDRAEVLAALYNGTRPIGLGWVHARATAMTRDEAAAILTERDAVANRFGFDGAAFDYLYGRPLKVTIGPTTVHRVDLYDRDAGVGAAARVIDALRRAPREGSG